MPIESDRTWRVFQRRVLWSGGRVPCPEGGLEEERTTATSLFANAAFTLRDGADGDVGLAGLHASARDGHALGDRPEAHGASACDAGGRGGGDKGGHVFA